MPRKYSYKPKAVRIKLTRLKLVAFVCVVTLVCILFLYRESIRSLMPLTEINYFGVELKFRTDLRKANQIVVYPNEKALVDLLMDPSIRKVSIGFVNTTQNNLTAVEGFEISYKLKIAYLVNGYNVEIVGRELESYSERGKLREPLIILVPPVDANETSVRVSEFTVYVSGLTKKEFDLAADKLLIVVMGIKV